MTSRRTRARAALFGLGFAVALSAGGRGALAQAPPAKTPTAEELKAAREMFQDAYKDEQEKRFAQALDKFQRVAAVKESASVRYRIGSVLEQLGRLREARDAFRALAASKANLSTPEQEIADNAAERAHQLDRKIPKLVLRLQPNPPADARVSIDGAPVPASTTPRRIELDPGEHLVQASSPSSAPSESKVTLTEGGEVEFTVMLGPKQVAPPPPPVEPPVEHRNNTLAYVALGAGGVLLIGGLVLLGVREGDISDIKSACGDKGGNCPASKKDDLESKHDQAQLFGPLGVGLGVAGLVVAGTGTYLLFRSPPKTEAAPPATNAGRTTTPPPSGGLRISTRPMPGGAMVGLGGAF
jgi:hypothetical protein